jgi:predicted MFS family arabinose efflux permease
VGHQKVIVPCLAMVVVGVALLSLATSRAGVIVSALVFGTGFGSAYPVFVAHLMKRVDDRRRGATFGALIGAFDTGIGTGSIAIGWLSEHYGLPRAFAAAATLAALSIPYYAYLRRRAWSTFDSARPA